MLVMFTLNRFSSYVNSNNSAMLWSAVCIISERKCHNFWVVVMQWCVSSCRLAREIHFCFSLIQLRNIHSTFLVDVVQLYDYSYFVIKILDNVIKH